MKKSLVNNLGLKLVSILLAFFIWLIVVQDNDPEKTKLYAIPEVTIENKDSMDELGKVYEVLNKTDVVTVYVEARSSVLKELSVDELHVKADLENLNDMGAVPYVVECDNTSIKPENIRVEPSALKVRIEPKVEKSFAVKALTTGEPANGYEIGSARFRQGDSIIIAGPQSLIDTIDRVNVTSDVTSLGKSKLVKGTLKITDKNGTEFADTKLKSLECKTASGVPITKTDAVEVYVELWRIQSDIKLEVSVVGEPANGYEKTSITVTPDTISLAGTENALSALNGVLSLKDEVSIDGAASDVTKKIELQDTLADQTSLKLEEAAAQTVTVKVGIEKAGSKVVYLPVNKLQVENAPKDLKITLTPSDKIAITVKAVTMDLDDLTEDDIEATLDLNTYKDPGTYKVMLKVGLPSGYEQASNVTIVVNLEKKEELETQTETETVKG